jgi:Chaperone of endosialidase
VGTAGPTGVTGATGVGVAGATGPSGPTGGTGAAGAVGATGVSGAAGSAGAVGATGPTGVSGVKGTTGATGPTGIGVTGATGVSGTAGAQGVTGVTGVTGVGTVGATGPSGAAGTAGAAGVTGATGPAGGTGAAGAVGATGVSGTAGAVGATGPTGVSGVKGTTGATGVGTTGVSGVAGTQGVTGATGPVGVGVTGATGPSGSTGPVGATGATGPSGAGASGTIDVLWVGPSAPVDPTIEMWWDTDEAAAEVGITQAAADTAYVNVVGDTMSGDLILMGDGPTRLRFHDSAGVEQATLRAFTEGGIKKLKSSAPLTVETDATNYGLVIHLQDPATAATGLLMKDQAGVSMASFCYYGGGLSGPRLIAHVAGEKVGFGDASVDWMWINATEVYAATPIKVNPAGAPPSISVMNGADSPFIGFYNQIGTRAGFVQGIFATPALMVAADPGYALKLRAASVDQIILGSDGNTSLYGNLLLGYSQLRVAGGVQGLILVDAGSGPYVGFYDGTTPVTIGNRKGFAGFTSSVVMAVTNEAVNGVLRLTGQASGSYIDFYTAGVFEARITAAGDLLIGKTASDSATIGHSIWGYGRAYHTAGNTTAYNLICNIPAATDNNVLQQFRRSDVAVGSIQMNGTTGVTYGTTSDGRLKDNISDLSLDDDASIDRVLRLRPVAFRWKIGEDGGYAEDGIPQGEVQHGFIAQELHTLVPAAVTRGRGTWPEKLAWDVQKAEYQAAVARLEEWRNADATTRGPEPEVSEVDTIGPFEPWMSDNSKLVPDLTAALQAVIRRVETLTARVAELETL